MEKEGNDYNVSILQFTVIKLQTFTFFGVQIHPSWNVHNVWRDACMTGAFVVPCILDT